MKRRLIFITLATAVVYFLFLFLLWQKCPVLADYILKCVMTFGIFGAVFGALFGDYLREKIFPISLRIESPAISNDCFDQSPQFGDCYVHHLRVENLTPHRAVNNCRVWLRKIQTQQVNGEWKNDPTFAVPRLMKWAPAEFSPFQRTFCKEQVFDLGLSLSQSRGFEIEWSQGGNIPHNFPVGRKLRFFFFAAADNYQKEEEFCFEIEIVPTIQAQKVTPARVTKV
jgi:hypothetical protein